MVAEGCSDKGPNGRKTFRDTEVRDAAMPVLSRNSGRIRNGPGHMVLEHRPGPGPSPTHQSGNEAYLTIPELVSLPREEAQKRVIEALDAVRKQGDSYHINKPRWMLIARRLGLTHAEIAVVLGMSEVGVRQAIKRAKDSTPEETL